VPWLDELRKDMENQNVIASLLEEVARTEAKTVVLSAESLAFIRRPETLRRALAPYSARVLLYLRRQDDFLASFYNQLIKSRLYHATFEEFLRQHVDNAIDLGDFRTSLPMCDYERLLNVWADAFGHDDVLVGVYEDYDLPVGILLDVARKTQIDISGLSPPAKDTNPAMQPSALSLKRRVNQFLSSEQERVTCEILFTSYVDGAEGAEVPREQIAANILRRQTILARYHEGNARVADRFFNSRPFLFKAPSGHVSPLPDFGEKDWEDGRHGLAAQMIARLITEVSRPKN
jgi:hypothetical protein